MNDDPSPRRLTISEARERLSAIVMHVQDPNAHSILTRHGKPVAAVVSMASLARIHRDEDAEAWSNPMRRPLGGVRRPDGRLATTSREAAELVREAQLTRWQERRILAQEGMEPLEGGEAMVDAVVPVEEPVAAEVKPAEATAKRGWWRFGRTKSD